MTNIQPKGRKGGFTIIEVVLVLAIAGLIFLMVFLALPALQRNQRDTQRREDLGKLVSQIDAFRSNNRGAIPTATTGPGGIGQGQGATPTTAPNAGGFLDRYMKQRNGEFMDPRGNYYQFTFSNNLGVDPSINPGTGDPLYNMIHYRQGVRCDGENFINTGNQRDFGVRIRLEGAGVFCQDSGGSN